MPNYLNAMLRVCSTFILVIWNMPKLKLLVIGDSNFEKESWSVLRTLRQFRLGLADLLPRDYGLQFYRVCRP